MLVRFVAVFLLAGCLLAPAGVWAGSGTADQVVVDRSTRNKILNDYTLLTRDCIQRAWTTPLDVVTPRAVKGKIGINYVVKRSGAVERIELVKGSGNLEMDRTLLEAIRSAEPFPPFPDGVDASKIMIRANFIVADVPTLPIVAATHEVDAKKSSEEPAPGHKKYMWGAPAGSSAVKTDEARDILPAAPPQKKYKWGIDR
ncbi:MAG TPA: TonB family protein [Desulfomonilaceae bacterium]|nr:TonB family protein [Desulfomonilaceae bacterium]